MDRMRQVRTVLIVTLLLNCIVSTAKIAAGYYFRSLSMVADGFHSFFDATSNIIGLVGIKVASLPPDESHPYGHKKYETFATVGIGALLFGTCFKILEGAYHRFRTPGQDTEVTSLSFAVIIITMAVNIFVAVYEYRKGRQYKSDFLMADAGHTKSDILASAGVLVSLIAVKLGLRTADPVIAVIIALMIARVGYGIIKSASGILVDASMINSDEVINLCMSVPGVKSCHRVRSRGREDDIFMDLRVHVDPELTIAKAHEISELVEELIKKKIAGVSDVVVHIEPEGDGE
jgi:cation diffusion facilitator family transporter